MRCVVICVVLALGLSAGSLLAFDAEGTVKKVDADKGVLFIHAKGQDRAVKVAKDAKVLGADGKELADGLRAKELKEGAEVTVTVEREDGGPVIKATSANPNHPNPTMDKLATGKLELELKSDPPERK